MREIPGYGAQVQDHILFLHFKIKDGGEGKNEKVEFLNATSGNGRMKNLAVPVHYPYQIKAVPRYTTSHFEIGITLEHPLFRSVEVASQDGTIAKAEITAREGNLSFRIQEESYMDRIDIYSITPERGEVKIYTLNLKQ
ncbi:hypothetical protein [Dyadobacter sp. CY323]|uniref:hypothetical protein n=1 Tax=Dyadobacter sp. CY323 TaxID=2907302 RepID=UPI001F37B60B|nr:hypothetical protein [Dyadobacter sp. CY323]MCE6990007.1 hypothetical protein [Dyadobacter sp. CY323]